MACTAAASLLGDDLEGGAAALSLCALLPFAPRGLLVRPLLLLDLLFSSRLLLPDDECGLNAWRRHASMRWPSPDRREGGGPADQASLLEPEDAGEADGSLRRLSDRSAGCCCAASSCSFSGAEGRRRWPGAGMYGVMPPHHSAASSDLSEWSEPFLLLLLLPLPLMDEVAELLSPDRGSCGRVSKHAVAWHGLGLFLSTFRPDLGFAGRGCRASLTLRNRRVCAVRIWHGP
jgi:hypothetical protein